MASTCMTLKTAARRASEIQFCVHVNGTGHYFRTFKASVLHECLDEWPAAESDEQGDWWTAEDDDGHTVWTFDGEILTIG